MIWIISHCGNECFLWNSKSFSPQKYGGNEITATQILSISPQKTKGSRRSGATKCAPLDEDATQVLDDFVTQKFEDPDSDIEATQVDKILNTFSLKKSIMLS